MFTGLIEGVGALASRETRGGDARLVIDTGTLPFDHVQLGESIAVNGCCLTVIAFDARSFAVDASNETLALTTLGRLPVGAPVNLERAMRPSDRLGGTWSAATWTAWRSRRGHGRTRAPCAGGSTRRGRCCATSRRRVRSAWTASA